MPASKVKAQAATVILDSVLRRMRLAPVRELKLGVSDVSARKPFVHRKLLVWTKNGQGFGNC
ncbi:hypothetical protein [Streptomyces sp. TE33382]